jgi:hypothetical protein
VSRLCQRRTHSHKPHLLVLLHRLRCLCCDQKARKARQEASDSTCVALFSLTPLFHQKVPTTLLSCYVLTWLHIKTRFRSFSKHLSLPTCLVSAKDGPIATNRTYSSFSIACAACVAVRLPSSTALSLLFSKKSSFHFYL